MISSWVLLQFGISCALFGIIWIIQLVHYPSFEVYESSTFAGGMKNHQDRISLVIIPLMLLELITSAYLSFTSPTVANHVVMGIVIGIWVCTFTIHVPLHSDLLLNGKNLLKVRKLVITNWIRTILWTLKLLIVLRTTIHSL